MKLEPKDRLQLIKDIAGHIIGIIIVTGSFAVVFAVLLGHVDITEPAVIAFVGTAIGYAFGIVAPVNKYYYGHEPEKIGKPDKKDSA